MYGWMMVGWMDGWMVGWLVGWLVGHLLVKVELHQFGSQDLQSVCGRRRMTNRRSD